jgi:hypothetical protein
MGIGYQNGQVSLNPFPFGYSSKAKDAHLTPKVSYSALMQSCLPEPFHANAFSCFRLNRVPISWIANSDCTALTKRNDRHRDRLRFRKAFLTSKPWVSLASFRQSARVFLIGRCCSAWKTFRSWSSGGQVSESYGVRRENLSRVESAYARTGNQDNFRSSIVSRW